MFFFFFFKMNLKRKGRMVCNWKKIWGHFGTYPKCQHPPFPFIKKSYSDYYVLFLLDLMNSFTVPGQTQLIRCHSSARFYSEIGENSNCNIRHPLMFDKFVSRFEEKLRIKGEIWVNSFLANTLFQPHLLVTPKPHPSSLYTIVLLIMRR